MKKSKLKIIKDPQDKVLHKIYRFFKDFNVLKVDKNFKWGWFSLYLNVYILNRYDIKRIKKEGLMLATILIKKISSENIIQIKFFEISDKINLEDKDLLYNTKTTLLKYNILDYQKVSIELKPNDYAKKLFFEKWLDFEEDTAKQLEYLTSNSNNNIILFKKLK